VRAEEYINAMRMRTDLARAMQTVMETVDVLMLPTAEPAASSSDPARRCSPVLPSPRRSNVGGNPALSVCCGFADNGLPFSLQIGRLFTTLPCCGLATLTKKATPWRAKRPVLA